MKRLPASVLALSLFSSGLAVTGEVLDGRPATVMQVITQAGYAARLQPGDSKNGPFITLDLDGDTVYLYLDGCKADLCTRINASTGYDADTTSDDVIDFINNWNLTNYSQAYLSTEEDSAYVDASYLMTGGYTQANLVAWLKVYLDDVTEFGDHLP